MWIQGAAVHCLLWAAKQSPAFSFLVVWAAPLHPIKPLAFPPSARSQNGRSEGLGSIASVPPGHPTATPYHLTRHQEAWQDQRPFLHTHLSHSPFSGQLCQGFRPPPSPFSLLCFTSLPSFCQAWQWKPLSKGDEWWVSNFLTETETLWANEEAEGKSKWYPEANYCA